MKPCSKCGEAERYNSGDCAPCARLRVNAKRLENVTAYRAKSNAYRATRREQVNEKWRLLAEKDRAGTMIRSAKQRARRYAVPFALTRADIHIPETCPILGIELKHARGNVTDCSPSLDRIVPALGYVPGNVKVISYRANRIKNDSTPEELLRIYAYYRECCELSHTRGM